MDTNFFEVGLMSHKAYFSSAGEVESWNESSLKKEIDLFL